MIYTVTFNPAIDYVVRLDAPLEVGQVNRACGEDCVLGGKGINVSGVLAQLGCPSVALGFVAGETGAWLERGLAAQGLHTDFVHLENGMTRINVKIKAEQETELNGAGPDIPDEALHQLEEKLDGLTENDVLILAGSIPASLPQNVYERLLARLDGRGVRCVVDATRALLVNVLPYHPFLIKPNNHELGEIVGRELHTDEEIAAAARALQEKGARNVLATDAEIVAAARTLQEKGARNVLVSMAGDGALLLDEQGQVHRIGCPKGKVVNSVGAGDSMVAGFVAGYLQSGSYAQALRLGTACGSATAFSLGLATKEKIDELLAQL
jgi:1-phosphofructokinase